MRALRLCGLTLAVVAAHLIAWRIALGGWTLPMPARAGVRWISMAPTMQRGAVPTPAPAPATAPAAFERQLAASPAPEPEFAATIDRDAVAPPPRPHSPIAIAQARAGDGGRARHAGAPAPMQAIYPTRAPPSAHLRYALVSGDAHASAAAPGTASLDWARDAANFSLRVAFEPGHAAAREWVSAGGFDAAGVAPTRLAERERGRDKRAINFDRADGRVRFSGATLAQPLAPGTQDRWSWIAQLAAIAEAAGTTADERGAGRDPGSGRVASTNAPRRRIHAGTTWAIEVAGLRGEMERWVFRVLPDTGLPPEAGPQRHDSSGAAGRAPDLLHVVREPERPYDLRVEAWLSPALHHLPAGLRMSTPPGSWSIALWPATPEDAADP